jgi:hypothetical protein
MSKRKDKLFFNFKPSTDRGFQTVYAPANGLAAYLTKTFGVHAGPPTGGEFAMNFILHVFILFTVLTTLFVVVIAPLETKSITKELNHACDQAISMGVADLEQQLSKMRPVARAAAVASLKATVPKLEELQQKYTTPDPAVVQSNKKTLNVAYGIIAVLGFTLITFISTMAGSGVKVRAPVAQVLLENLIVFIFVGGAEALFFLQVASKFIPIMPSSLGTTVLTTLQQLFPAPPAATPAPGISVQ